MSDGLSSVSVRSCPFHLPYHFPFIRRKISACLVIVAVIAVIVFMGKSHRSPPKLVRTDMELYLGLIYLMLHRNPQALNQLRSGSADVSYALLIRVSIFSVLPMIALVYVLLLLSGTSSRN